MFDLVIILFDSSTLWFKKHTWIVYAFCPCKPAVISFVRLSRSSTDMDLKKKAEQLFEKSVKTPAYAHTTLHPYLQLYN